MPPKRVPHHGNTKQKGGRDAFQSYVPFENFAERTFPYPLVHSKQVLWISIILGRHDDGWCPARRATPCGSELALCPTLELMTRVRKLASHSKHPVHASALQSHARCCNSTPCENLKSAASVEQSVGSFVVCYYCRASFAIRPRLWRPLRSQRFSP